MKPKLATDVLQKASGGNFISSLNRFSRLGSRDSSPMRSGSFSRERSDSFKRKATDEGRISYASIAGKTIGGASQAHSDGSWREEVECNIVKVNSLCDKVKEDISNATADASILGILLELVEAVKLNNKVNSDLLRIKNVPEMAVPVSSNASMVSLGAIPKKPRVNSKVSSQAQGPSSASINSQKLREESMEEEEEEVDPQVSRFRRRLRRRRALR